MQRALNELMGRSTVDPSVREAFQEGTLTSILLECGFSSDQAAKLAGLQAESLGEYLQLAHEFVSSKTEPRCSPDHPWPSDGIAERTKQRSKEEAA